MAKSTLVINLVGGPGSGKSTTAAGVFYELKQMGVNCELITEYAKDKTWEGSQSTLSDQLYVFGKQHHRMFPKIGQVDVIITDSPLILSLIYGNHMKDSFKTLVKETFDDFWNMNYYIVRKKPYNPSGRNQTEEEAKAIDVITRNVLKENNIPFTEINGDRDAAKIIANEVLTALE